MSDHSPRLDLPYLYPAQAQKHVTVNEAFERLDALTQLVVEDFGASAPPPGPSVGQIWALGAAPTGAWAAQGGHLAIATQGGGWLFIQPSRGWRAYGKANSEMRIFDGTNWTQATPEQVTKLGISAAPSDTNRFALASAASLFSHAGAGHQIKVNKAGPSDTASLLFQTNWTGHAEMGLAGNNDFAIKVSADGTTWRDALAFAGASGLASGAAVQSGALDAAAGKLLTVGAFGLGKGAALPGSNVDQAEQGGLYAGFGGTNGSPSAGANPFASSAAPFALQVMQSGVAQDQWVQLAAEIGTARLRMRSKVAGAAVGAWTDVLTSTSAIGQLANGAIIETGSDANGYWTRLADGTQICLLHRLTLNQRSAADCHATWTFPQAFVNAAQISVQASLTPAADSTDPFSFASDAAPGADQIGALAQGKPTTTQVEFAAARISGAPDFVAGNKLYASVLAIGRWL